MGKQERQAHAGAGEERSQSGDEVNRCFACARKLGKNPNIADCADEQTVYVGAECFNLIRKAGEAGYQPPKGGPRLYLLPPGLTQAALEERHKRLMRSGR